MCVNLERFLRKVVHISISPLSIALNLSNLFNRFLDTQFYRKIFALSSGTMDGGSALVVASSTQLLSQTYFSVTGLPGSSVPRQTDIANARASLVGTQPAPQVQIARSDTQESGRGRLSGSASYGIAW